MFENFVYFKEIIKLSPIIDYRLKSSMCSYQEDTKSNQIVTTKFRINPNEEQRLQMRKWFGAYRKTYNLCVNYAQKDSKKYKLKTLRKLFVNSKGLEESNLEYLAEVPYDVRDEAVRDLIKAYRSSVELYKSKKDKSKPFEMKFKSRKEGDTIPILHKHINSKSYSFITSLIPHHLLCKINRDFKLMRTKSNKYYVLVPVDDEPVRYEYDQPLIASTDPGVRTFQTIYDTHGSIIEIGNGDITKVNQWKRSAEKLERESTKDFSKSKKSHLRKAARKLREKIQDRIKDLHHKVSKFLLSNYETVLLPNFRISQMVNKQNQKISKSTKRDLYGFNHYQFKQRMLYKKNRFLNSHLHITDEKYTTMTCGKCGLLNSVGKEKIYNCSRCNSCFDRDHNGARNNFVKFFNDKLRPTSSG